MVESKYTKKEDVGEGMLVTFVSYKKDNVAMDDEPERIRIVATFKELKKPVVLNRTNLKKMAKLIRLERDRRLDRRAVRALQRRDRHLCRRGDRRHTSTRGRRAEGCCAEEGVEVAAAG